MKGDERQVDGGHAVTEKGGEHPHQPAEGGVVVIEVVVVGRLHQLAVEAGEREHNRTSVDDDRDPALEQLRRDDVRPLGGVNGAKGGARVVPDELIYIVAVDDRIVAHPPQPAFQLAQHAGLHQPFDITDTEIGAGDPPELLKFKFQIGCGESPADHRDVYHHRLDKALARSAEHPLALRFGDRAGAPALGVDRETAVRPVHEEQRGAEHDLRLEFVERCDFVIKGDKKARLLDGVHHRAPRLHLGQLGERLEYRVVEYGDVHQSVEKEESAGTAGILPRAQCPDLERGVPLEQVLHHPNISGCGFVKLTFLHRRPLFSLYSSLVLTALFPNI